MSTTNVRIPDPLHQELRDAAEKDRRTLNQEMIVLWEEALKARAYDARKFSRPEKSEPPR